MRLNPRKGKEKDKKAKVRTGPAMVVIDDILFRLLLFVVGMFFGSETRIVKLQIPCMASSFEVWIVAPAFYVLPPD
jgi:hypothetical protein